ncbi:AimR family lysis-lysogeny pheromone receptor [Geomicrobium sp. JSM 1781026]
MSKLKEALREAMDKDRTLAQSLAKVAGYSNPTPIYKFVNHPAREFQSFATLLKVTEAAFPDRIFELMETYIPSLDVNGKNARYALEYTSIEMQHLHDQHIERMLDASNAESVIYAQYYKIMQQMKVQLSPDEDMVKNISKLPAPTDETYTLKYISMAYLFAHEGEHSLFTLCSKLAYKSIAFLTEEYMAESYKMRIHVLLGVSYTQLNQLEKARHYLKQLYDIHRPALQSWFSLHMGRSYLFSDFQKAENYFTEGMNNPYSLERFVSLNKRSANLLYSYWGVNKHYSLDESLPVNQLSHVIYLISQKKHNDSVQKIKSLNTNALSEWDRATLYYFQYRMTEDDSFLYQAIAECKRCNEWHFRSVCIKELTHLNPHLREALEV